MLCFWNHGVSAAPLPAVAPTCTRPALSTEEAGRSRAAALAAAALGAVHSSSAVGRRLRRRRWGTPMTATAGEAACFVAPLVSAQGAPGGGCLAVGAVEVLKDGSMWLHGQVENEDHGWRPVLLHCKEPGMWEADGLKLQVSLQELAAACFPSTAPLRPSAPGWPAALIDELEEWPLKGPGTVVADPQFFVQRAAHLSARPGAGPVLFPDAANRLRLPTAKLVQGASERLAQRSNLQKVLGNDESTKHLGSLLERMPTSVAAAHFDLTRAAASEGGSAFSVAFTQQPLGLSCESMTWTRGGVVRSVTPGSEAALAGCCVGDVLRSVDGKDVREVTIEELDGLLSQPPPLHLVFERPQLSDYLYLRELPAIDEAMEVFAGAGSSCQQLVPELSSLLGGKELFLSEQTPMIFAGDGGTSSHIHIDRKPLVQFCHVLHGLKFFCVAPLPEAEPGPVVPWAPSLATRAEEVAIRTDLELPQQAAEWLSRPEVALAAVRPGDLLLFQGSMAHFGANGIDSSGSGGGVCVTLFHGAQPVREMARGTFGPAYQALALRTLQS